MHPSIKGPLRPNPINPRYFTDDTGNAVYLTGSHNWFSMQDMWLEGQEPAYFDYDGFLQMMEDNFHNFMRFWQWIHPKNAAWSQTPTLFTPQPYARTGPGLAVDGLPKFDLERFNPEYFARLRQRVEAAANRGIYCAVMLFEAWAIKWPTDETDMWATHPMNGNNNINGVTDDPKAVNGRNWGVHSMRCPQILCWQEEFVKKVVDTLNDLDNVLWEVCNEIPYTPEALEWTSHIALFIKSYEAEKPHQHMVGITAEGGDHDNAQLFSMPADWISPSNGRLFEYRYNPPGADGSKVVINDTDHLWGHGCEVAWIWKSFTRGHNVLFMDPWGPIPDDLDWWMDGDVSRNQRYYYAWDPMRRNLGYARRFALKVDLNRCKPHPELFTSGYCLANPGFEYICYLPCPGAEGLDMWDAGESTFAVEWFSPTTGHTVKGSTLRGGNRHVVSAPWDGPAVLFISREG